MKKLNEASLKVGDIILTTTTAAVSKAIRMATRSDISHAMIYVQSHSVIDATEEGVQSRNTQRLLFDDDCSVHVLRHRDGLSDEQCRSICTFVRTTIGAQYSRREAIQTALGGGQHSTSKQFCSRLAAQAYASAGIKLATDPNFCSPAEIASSPCLIEVQGAVVAVTAREAARWEGREDLPQIMRSAINFVLDGARVKNKDIQSFDELDRHLIQHPEDDDHVCRLLEASGYLTVWRVDLENSPWQYDLDLMSAFSGSEPGIEDYCWSVLSDEAAGPNRYFVNRGGYAMLSKQYGLHVFGLMMELYDHLSTLHRRRVEVATKWLEANGLLVPASERVLRPHSPEWFAALEIWNPAQAAMTKIAIATAGSLDVCSICGDDPAADYRLEEEYRPPGGVDTLRLCDDCLDIKRNSGEPFVAFAKDP
jgi:Permuted papain-like amidase enzyme, YaeF/YiiX, C92 family